SIWENIADAIEDIDEDAGSSMKDTADAGNKQIGIEAAKQIALADAKVALKDVTFIKAELDNEDGRAVYEIEFYSGNVEYDYDIDALSGEIISNDFDIEDYSVPTQSAVAPQQTAAAPAQPQTAAPTQLQTAAPTPAPTQPQTTAPTPAPTQPQTAAPTPAPTAAPTPAPTQPAAPSTISADRAKQIALSHAGVGGANFTKVELDTDDGVQVYEIEFKVGNVEYEYDINAISGAIISSKSEVDD
ncbi:MAG: peptidase, partial [Lachnospiraceae bacterium]